MPEPPVSTAGPLLNRLSLPWQPYRKRNKQTVKFFIRNIHSIFHHKGQQQILAPERGAGHDEFLVSAAVRAAAKPYIRAPTPWNGYSIDMGTE
jgi:hypothetical protein